jgi:hypothetical protein
VSIVNLPTGDALAHFDGYCLELVDHLLHEHPTGKIIYVTPRNGSRIGKRWRYHCALLLDGIVHDAWHPDARLPPAEYVEHVFGKRTKWEINPGSDEAAR